MIALIRPKTRATNTSVPIFAGVDASPRSMPGITVDTHTATAVNSTCTKNPMAQANRAGHVRAGYRDTSRRGTGGATRVHCGRERPRHPVVEHLRFEIPLVKTPETSVLLLPRTDLTRTHQWAADGAPQ